VARRIGILGGSFDPIHLGHLRCAEEVREAFGLDAVAFVPANRPPHKPDRRLADGSQRLAMVKLAVAGNPAFYASSLEIDRGGISYSIDTLEALAAIERDAELFFIVGVDAFGEMQTWKDVARLFTLASVVVTNRPPHTAQTSIEHLPVAAREAFCYDPPTLSYRHRSGTRLHFHPITALDISATALRERVRREQSIRYLVPPDVEQYIREHGLYRSGESVG
jgi:nicotinate-nucleotide adenylyltransferase